MKTMKTTIHTLLCILCMASAYSQNLVPNPSFEEFINCPDNGGNVEDDLMNWKSSRNTPDYFHSCAISSGFDVPSNFGGFQLPFEGEAYIGLLTYDITSPTFFSESIGVELTEPLIVGEKYYISFNYSLTYGTQDHNFTHNKIGVQFSTEEYSIFNPAPINNITHLETTDLPVDSSIWVPFMGSFVADEAYAYLNLGNFYETFFIDTIGLEDENFRAYYYFDNICVSSDSIQCNLINSVTDINQNNLIDLYIDFNGILNIKIHGFTELNSIDLYNIQGQKVHSSSTKIKHYQTIDLSAIPSQVIIAIIKTQNSIHSYKLIKP